MNRKTLIMITVAVAIVVLALLGFWFLAKNTSSPSGAGGDSMQIPGTDFQPVTVKNFTKTSPVYDRSVVIYSDSNFDIEYDSVSQRFQITFTDATLAEINNSRARAEDKLLSTLGVSQSEACRLPVDEVIPNSEALSLNPNHFYLSFCPGGPTFPQ